MRWLWRKSPNYPENEKRLDNALERVQDIQDRGNKAAESIEGRLRRNHFGEAVIQIARTVQREY